MNRAEVMAVVADLRGGAPAITGPGATSGVLWAAFELGENDLVAPFELIFDFFCPALVCRVIADFQRLP